MYTPEFSRDIEPVKAPYGDMYYRFMRDYIHAYKAGMPMPQNLLEELDKGSDRPDFDMDGIPNQVEGTKDSDADGTPDQWLPLAYDDVDSRLWPVAKRSLLAHVERIQLLAQNQAGRP